LSYAMKKFGPVLYWFGGFCKQEALAPAGVDGVGTEWTYWTRWTRVDLVDRAAIRRRSVGGVHVVAGPVSHSVRRVCAVPRVHSCPPHPLPSTLRREHPLSLSLNYVAVPVNRSFSPACITFWNGISAKTPKSACRFSLVCVSNGEFSPHRKRAICLGEERASG
jgi:hypothetical protein